MRQLRVVGVTDDGKHLRLATSAKGEPTHRLAIDDTLRAALRGELVGPGGPVQSALTPREIQARLRAGESAESLAKAAGVPVSRIERYSGPVESERARVVEEARAARMTRARRGLSAVPLGLAVDAALATTAGVKLDTIDWTARRRRDGGWVVALTWLGRGGQRRAEWLWVAAGKVLSALDSTAARIGYVDHSEIPARRVTPVKRQATKKAPTKKAPAKQAAPQKTAVKKTAPKKATEKPTAAKKTAVKKTAPKKAGPKKAAPKKAAPAAKAKVSAKRIGESGPAVPSWDQVLLGVTPRGAGRQRR